MEWELNNKKLIKSLAPDQIIQIGDKFVVIEQRDNLNESANIKIKMAVSL